MAINWGGGGVQIICRSLFAMSYVRAPSTWRYFVSSCVMPRESTTVSHMSRAEIASPSVAEGYPKISLLTNVVAQLCSRSKKGTLAEDILRRQKIVLEKKQLCSWCCATCACVCSGRLSVVESWKYSWVVLNSLCSGILIGQMESSDLTGQDCVSLNVYTYTNTT